MAGLVPAIHVFDADEGVDARDEPAHDVRRCTLIATIAGGRIAE
jgi:hypothetical protein